MSLFKLPLRLFGLKDIPAVPFDIGGSIDTLLRLDIRGHETEQALQGLTNEYTLDGQTARSYSFLFGGEAADEAPREAREQIRKVLSGNPLKVSAAIGKASTSTEASSPMAPPGIAIPSPASCWRSGTRWRNTSASSATRVHDRLHRGPRAGGASAAPMAAQHRNLIGGVYVRPTPRRRWRRTGRAPCPSRAAA